MSRSLSHKTILITGAGSGLGRATALHVAELGARVIACDINLEAVAAVAETIEGHGGRGHFFEMDVTNEGQIAEVLGRVHKDIGVVPVGVNNAGVDHPLTGLADLEESDFDRVININLKGVWLCMKYEIKHMLESGGGQIINMASVAGLKAAPTMSIYSASKFGVVGLTKSAALEYVK